MRTVLFHQIEGLLDNIGQVVECVDRRKTECLSKPLAKSLRRNRHLTRQPFEPLVLSRLVYPVHTEENPNQPFYRRDVRLLRKKEVVATRMIFI